MLSDQYNILLIDDDPDILESYQDLLEQEGYSVFCVSEPLNIVEQIHDDWNGVVICDVLLPAISGLDILENIIQTDNQLPVIMITGHGDVPMAVEAVKKGAMNFLEKPIIPEKLLTQVGQALTKRTAVIENRQWQRQKLNEIFIGNSDWICSLRNRLQKLADSNLPVFLWGEIGTGRHLAATYLHKLSKRNQAPFVTYECSENGNSPIEHFIKQTDGGTLVLKNIHNLSAIEQQHLINLLHNDENKFRLIIISDISLPELIRRQLSSSELYYLFIYTQIEMLPLNKHSSDIADIFIHYVQKTCMRLHKENIHPDKKFIHNLLNKEWKGNVTELVGFAELYAIGLASSVPTTPPLNTESVNPLDEQISKYEKQIIEDALALHQGKVNEAAAYLNIPRKKLYLRMKKYGLDKKSYKF